MLDCSKRKLKMSCSLSSRGEIRLPRTDKRGLTLREGCVQKHQVPKDSEGYKAYNSTLKKFRDSPKLLYCKIWASKVAGELCINNGYCYFKKTTFKPICLYFFLHLGIINFQKLHKA